MSESYVYVTALTIEGSLEVSFWHTTVAGADEHEAYSNGYKAFTACSNADLGLPRGAKSQILNDYVVPLSSLRGDK